MRNLNVKAFSLCHSIRPSIITSIKHTCTFLSVRQSAYHPLPTYQAYIPVRPFLRQSAPPHYQRNKLTRAFSYLLLTTVINSNMFSLGTRLLVASPFDLNMASMVTVRELNVLHVLFMLCRLITK